MREIVVRVPAAAVEDVLDRLLPIVPGGVRETRRGSQVELTMRGDELPALREIQRLVGRVPHRLKEREAADDWRERRLADYEPNLIAERLLVRPDWAPSPEPGVLDVVLSESSAFGVGAHPTTRVCLGLLLELEPTGSFADLGCGTGVLAITAAKLGWKPVAAVDVQPEAVEATRANAALNGVAIEPTLLDLSAAPPPAATGFAANVPAELHAKLAPALAESARAAVVSGFTAPDAADVLETYAARGLDTRRRVDSAGWTVARLERDLRDR
jgi:ribosomal protein L11 methyltransferase